jgi:metal-sulfur cluster biosynthetic enzyme
VDTLSIDRREIARNLRHVIDPELGVNVVDLGLVYSILFDDGKLIVEYTATTPGCPMRRYLQQQIEEALS